MPFQLNDYKCLKCDTKFEYLDGDDNDPPKCKDCGSQEIEKQLTYAGYNMNSGGSSTRPKNSGCFKGRKQ